MDFEEELRKVLEEENIHIKIIDEIDESLLDEKLRLEEV